MIGSKLCGREVKLTLSEVKDQLLKGTLRGLCDSVGINFSNPLTAKISSRGTDELKSKIEDFAIDNSLKCLIRNMLKKVSGS